VGRERRGSWGSPEEGDRRWGAWAGSGVKARQEGPGEAERAWRRLWCSGVPSGCWARDGGRA